MSASDWEIRELDRKHEQRLAQLDAARERSMLPYDTTPERGGEHRQHMDREDALRDYQTKVQDLHLVYRHFEIEQQDGYPLYTERELLQLVDRARQALQVISACAHFVGRK